MCNSHVSYRIVKFLLGNHIDKLFYLQFPTIQKLTAQNRHFQWYTTKN